MGITQKQIARDLGISFVTVSRAINNSGYVSPELRKRILDYVEKKTYVPHRVSQVLVRNRIRKVSFFSSTDPVHLWNDINRGMVNAGEQLKHFNYEFHYIKVPNGDTKKYIQLLKRELNKGIEGVGFVNQKQYDMGEIIGRIEKAGIPYLIFNRDAPESNRLRFIGPNYPAGGRLVANFLCKSLLLKKRGKVLIINSTEWNNIKTDKTDVNSERLRGFLEIAEKYYPGIKIQIEFLHSKSKKSIPVKIYEILKQYEHQVDAVYLNLAENKNFIQALEKLDYGNTITLLHDVDESALYGIKNNILTTMVYQDPFLQGYAAAKTMESMLESKIQERMQDMEIAHTLVFKENLNFLEQIRTL
jgi:LacI family transcriptional regulator